MQIFHDVAALQSYALFNLYCSQGCLLREYHSCHYPAALELENLPAISPSQILWHKSLNFSFFHHFMAGRYKKVTFLHFLSDVIHTIFGMLAARQDL